MSLSFAQVHFALGFVTGIAPARADAFISRLKQWQKMGFPEGVNVGRGTKAAYGAKQLYQLAIMLKLMRVGLTPQRAQRVVIDGWPTFQDAIIETVTCLANREDHVHYCFIQLDALSDLQAGEAGHMHVYVDIFTSDEVGLAFLEYAEEASEEELLQQKYSNFLVKNRLAISVSIEIDSMLILLWLALAQAGVPEDIFAEEMAQWYEDRRERGRIAQEEAAHFDQNIASASIADSTLDFDVAGAARAALTRLPADARYSEA